MVEGIERPPLVGDRLLGLGRRARIQRFELVDQHPTQAGGALGRLGPPLGGFPLRRGGRLGLARRGDGRREPLSQCRIGITGFPVPLCHQSLQPRIRAGTRGELRELRDFQNQFAQRAAAYLRRAQARGFAGRLCRFRFLGRAQHGARAPRGRRVDRARRDGPDGGQVTGHPVERGQRRVPEAAPGRGGRELGRVAHLRQRRAAHVLELRPAGDARERLLIAGQPRNGRHGHVLAPGRLGHQHEVLVRGQPRQRRQRVERRQARGLIGLWYAPSAMSSSTPAASSRTPGSGLSRSRSASTATVPSLDTATRRTRGSSSSRAMEASKSCSSSGISWTPDARADGSTDFHFGSALNRLRIPIACPVGDGGCVERC